MPNVLNVEFPRRNFLRRLALVTGGLAITGLSETLGSMRAESAMQEDTLAKLQRTHYALLSSYNQPAHDWFTPADGKWHGMDVDIVEYILPKIGVTKWDYIVADWSAMIPGLQARRWDMMSIGMSILPKRVGQVLFSEPAYRQGSAIIVRAGNPKKINGMSDYAGHKIGAVLGAGELDDVKSVQGAEAIPYKTAAEMFADIKIGRIDAAEMDEAEAGFDLKQTPDPDLEVLHQWTGKVWFLAGLVFRMEDSRLKAVFDQNIKQMKADGSMLTILERYGFAKENMVPVNCKLEQAGPTTYKCAGQS